MTAATWLYIAIASLAIGAVLSSLFHSLTEISRTAIEELAATRKKPSARRRIQRILDDLDGHATAVALPRILCNTLAAVSTVFHVSLVREELTPSLTAAALGVVISSIAVWIIGMIIPHAIARHAGEQTVYSLSPILRVVYIATRPIAAITAFFDEVVKRLAGRTDADAADVLKDEVLDVVEEGHQEGQFDAVERDMIGAVVKFRDTTVAQIMTPRTEMEAIELTDDLGKITSLIRQKSHSRVPVFEGSIDRIVGIFYVKDLMRWLASEGSRGGKTFSFRSILRPALFVPETKTIRELLQELLDKRVHIVMVADEYGGTAGLVTFEDIVEEVFGDIQDEYELPEETQVDVKIDAASRSAEIDARAYIKDANSALRELGIEIPESEDYDTVGGFVTVTLGRIPAAGAVVRTEQFLITVLEAEPTRVTRVRIDASERTAGSGTTDDSPQFERATTGQP
jgi:putative hemolysin